MKKQIFILVVCLMTVFTGKGCNFSDFTLVSVSQVGPNWVVDANLCIGYGRTGTVNGADGATMDLAFGIYGPGGSPVTVVSFSPAILSGAFTACNMPGFDIGSAPFAPFFSQATIYYQYDFASPGCLNGFSCITSTAACGNVGIQCIPIQLTLDVLPDSIRVFGIEGAGNPTGGCYPNNDMLISFSSMPVVWAGIHAENKNDLVELNWACASQQNNDFFTVERKAAGENSWTDVGRLQGAGTVSQTMHYSLADQPESEGTFYYRVAQTDLSGNTSYSPIAEVYYEKNTPSVSFYPNPASDILQVRFEGILAAWASVEIADVSGKTVLQFRVETETTSTLPLGELRPGIYFVSVASEGNQFREKIVVQ